VSQSFVQRETLCSAAGAVTDGTLSCSLACSGTLSVDPRFCIDFFWSDMAASGSSCALQLGRRCAFSSPPTRGDMGREALSVLCLDMNNKTQLLHSLARRATERSQSGFCSPGCYADPTKPYKHHRRHRLTIVPVFQRRVATLRVRMPHFPCSCGTHTRDPAPMRRRNNSQCQS